MPSDFMLKTMNTVHRTLLKVSFGKVGWNAGSMPVLELTTIGRKSGQPRSVMLTSPFQEGDSLVIVEPTSPQTSRSIGRGLIMSWITAWIAARWSAVSSKPKSFENVS